nr:hypothetical protein [Pseudomonas sp.]
MDVRLGMRITGLYLPGQGCRRHWRGCMVSYQPSAALVIKVQAQVSPAWAKRLRSLQMEIACPLALVGEGLADRISWTL